MFHVTETELLAVSLTAFPPLFIELGPFETSPGASCQTSSWPAQLQVLITAAFL